MIEKDLEVRKFEMYHFLHDVMGFLSAKIDYRPEKMRGFIHAINEMITVVT